MRRLLLALVVVMAVVATGCAGEDDPVPSAVTEASSATVSQLGLHVEGEIPHRRDAFTEGLLLADGQLFESTGLEGRSSVRRVDPATGEVAQQTELDPGLFGEGLALVGDRLIQLTWTNGIALVYDRDSLEEIDQFRYDGEGWGLCFDGDQLIMSNGSDQLTFRDPETFSVTGTVAVRADGDPVERINELECVDGHVWANVWQTDLIIEIDPTSGQVVSSVDASGLLPESARQGADVLNGIAYDPERQLFLITGKNWPTLYEVTFEPV